MWVRATLFSCPGLCFFYRFLLSSVAFLMALEKINLRTVWFSWLLALWCCLCVFLPERIVRTCSSCSWGLSLFFCSAHLCCHCHLWQIPNLSCWSGSIEDGLLFFVQWGNVINMNVIHFWLCVKYSYHCDIGSVWIVVLSENFEWIACSCLHLTCETCIDIIPVYHIASLYEYAMLYITNKEKNVAGFTSYSMW